LRPVNRLSTGDVVDYRGHGLKVSDIHVTQSPGDRTPAIKRELRRRSAIEPIIGHTKSDGLLERNRLAGASGDAINAILVGAGHNIRLLLAWLEAFLSFLCALLISNGSRPKSLSALAQSAVRWKTSFSRAACLFPTAA
jgi:hypothetical protein